MRSIFSVITPASGALLTIDELRAAAGVTGGAQDAALTAMGKQVSEAIARDCGVAWDGEHPPTLLSEGCRQTFILARPVARLRLARRPVSAIASITIDGEPHDVSRVLRDRASGVIFLRCGDWPAAEVEIHFTAGFSTVPADLVLAASKLVTALWAERLRDPGLKKETVEGVGSQEFWVAPASDPLLSAEISELLSPYRERWF